MSTIEAHRCWVETESFLNNLCISAQTGILAAVSGGPDSTALLSVLKNLSLQRGFRLSGAYVDHGIRSVRERKAEQEQVLRLERDLSIPIYKKNYQPGMIEGYAKKYNTGIEAAARRFRYNYLYKIQEIHNFDFIALGHTLDDQLETLISRFFQGAGTTGMSGIKGKTGLLIRPFLYLEKKEILDYLETSGIPFVLDSTNLNSDYQRNGVRNELIPVVRKLFPGFEKSLLKFLEKSSLVSAYITGETDKNIIWTEKEGGIETDLGNFCRCNTVLRRQALLSGMNLIGGELELRIPYGFIEQIDDSIRLSMPGGPFSRGHGVRILKIGGFLRVEPDVAFPEKKGYLSLVDFGFTDMHCRSGFRLRKTLLSSNIEYVPWLFDKKELYPFIIRSWRNGDKIKFGNGMKEVRKLFQEWKVPDHRKWEIPIIEDVRGIAAVFGSFFGFPDRYRDPRLVDAGIYKKKIVVFSRGKDGDD